MDENLKILSNKICISNSFNPNPKLTKDDYFQIEAETNLSRTEIDKCFKKFLKHCKTGKIQKKRISDIMILIFPQKSAKIVTDRIFRWNKFAWLRIQCFNF